MTWSIVPMRHEHLDAVVAMRMAAFFDGTPRTAAQDAEGLAALTAVDGFETALVCVAAGQAVGTCLLVRRELDQRHDLTPWLAGLVVVPAHRGKGVGAALVRAIGDHALGAGCEALHLYTDASEPFYARLGWTVADRFIADGEPSVLMMRRL